MRKKRIGWEVANRELNVEGRSLYVRSLQYPLLLSLFKSKDYTIDELKKNLRLLSSKGHCGDSLNCDGRIKMLSFKDGKLYYYIEDSDILIHKISTKQMEDCMAAGYYKVYFQDDEWRVSSKAEIQMDTKHSWEVSIKDPNGRATNSKAHFSAVAGKFDSASNAAKLLIDHIKGGFAGEGQFTKSNIDKSGNHYSMLWQGVSDHKQGSGVSLLATSIRQNVAKDARVHTLVHGVGAKTFAKSVEQLSGQIPKGKYKESLGKQQFYFSNPKGISSAELRKKCEALGVTFVGSNVNKYDLAQFSRNAVTELYKGERSFIKVIKALKSSSNISRKTIKASVSSGGALLAVDVMSQMSSFSAMLKSYGLPEEALPEGMNKYLYAAAGAFLALPAGLKLIDYSANLPFKATHLLRSSFGKQNQKWHDPSSVGIQADWYKELMS